MANVSSIMLIVRIVARRVDLLARTFVVHIVVVGVQAARASLTSSVFLALRLRPAKIDRRVRHLIFISLVLVVRLATGQSRMLHIFRRGGDHLSTTTCCYFFSSGCGHRYAVMI